MGSSLLKTAVLSYSWPIVLGIVEKKHKEKMSDVLSEYKSKSYQWKITITDPPLTYLMKQGISRFEIALAVKISYPLLQIWHQKVGDGYDYIDFFNASVAGTWFQVSRVTGYRIQRRLEREAGVIAKNTDRQR